ncbi:MAG TPA: hypothetical protein VK864_20515 [Longimicrobiales bacterium]|nr:hypothetical protein [Longimicrobiales bacterium]
MKRYLVWLLPLALAGCDLDLTGLGSCEYDREFDDWLGVSGTDNVRVIAEAGDLRVQGRRGLTQVRVHARVCAEDLSDLDDAEVIIERVGSTISVLSLAPGRSVSRGRVDLWLEVPDWMLVGVDHEAGDIEVVDVAGASIYDDSGDIRLDRILGDVEINDGSGDLWLDEIAGDVWLFDESGSIDVREVSGGVEVAVDGSGDLWIRDVDDDVYIGEDGSGNILVENVGGDLTVIFDDSGSITYRNVYGQVHLPR